MWITLTHQTLILSLNLTSTVNLSPNSDWLIGMLFQDLQRCWSRNMLYLMKSGSPSSWQEAVSQLKQRTYWNRKVHIKRKDIVDLNISWTIMIYVLGFPIIRCMRPLRWMGCVFRSIKRAKLISLEYIFY